MAQYELHIDSPDGNSALAVVTNFMAPVDEGGAALEYALNVGQIGVLKATLPPNYDPFLLLDGRLSVWRTVGGRPAYRDGDACFLIRKWEYGEEYTTVYGFHANELLRRRIVNYYSGSTYTAKTTTAADNLIKAFASQQLGSGIVSADRLGSETQADISTWLTIQSDLTLGETTSKAAAWRNLFDVVRELCDTSTQAGTYLTAEIVAVGQAGLELRTYTQQRGVDRRASSGQPLIFARARGNVENVIVTVDRSEEVTFVTAGGGGEQALRTTNTDSDATRMGESIFNRREAFAEDTNTTDTDVLLAIAQARLREGRPRISLRGDLVETNACARGIHFDLGDYVTVEGRGQQYDTRIDTIGVTVSAGEQRSRVQFRVNEVDA
jgi:Siphovirus ReqiPepy6 Gp37-like protein